jgi:hypothetical protein
MGYWRGPSSIVRGGRTSILRKWRSAWVQPKGRYSESRVYCGGGWTISMVTSIATVTAHRLTKVLADEITTEFLSNGRKTERQRKVNCRQK